MNRMSLFLSSLRLEFLRIKWPSKQEFTISLIAVMAIGTVFVVYVMAIDALFYSLVMKFLSIGH